MLAKKQSSLRSSRSRAVIGDGRDCRFTGLASLWRMLPLGSCPKISTSMRYAALRVACRMNDLASLGRAVCWRWYGDGIRYSFTGMHLYSYRLTAVRLFGWRSMVHADWMKISPDRPGLVRGKNTAWRQTALPKTCFPHSLTPWTSYHRGGQGETAFRLYIARYFKPPARFARPNAVRCEVLAWEWRVA